MVNFQSDAMSMVLRQPIIANNYFTIITIVGPTINRNGASLKSRIMFRWNNYASPSVDNFTNYLPFTELVTDVIQLELNYKNTQFGFIPIPPH